MQIVKEYVKGGISQQEAARQAGVVRDTIVRWVRIYRNERTLGFASEKNNVTVRRERNRR